VVIGVEADVVEVVVLAAGADALLRVGGAGVAAGNDAGPLAHVGFFWPRKMGTNWFMPALVKSRFGESGMSETRRHDGVLLRPEEVEERLANLAARHNQSGGG
jgi:hypothetical protein